MSSIITRKDAESADADEQKSKSALSANKRSAAGGYEVGSDAAPKKSRFDVKEKNGGVVPPPAAVDAAMASSLSSTQIKLMMAHAQREIEERKRALSNLRDKDPLLASVPQIGMPVALATQALAKKPTPEDADKAKKIAELQAQIRAKLTGNLANIIQQQPTAVAAAAAAAAQQQQERPKPLILDEEGRTVDKSGRAINIPTVTPTLKANIRAKKREVFQRQTTGNEGGTGASGTSSGTSHDDAVKFFDDRIALKPTVRNKRTLRFHEPGKFQQLAERMRMKSQLERLQNEISQIARKTGISSATKLALIAPKQDMPDDVPAMEWWDSVILSQDLQTMDEESGLISIRKTAISNLIEHPTQMKPPSEYKPRLNDKKYIELCFHIICLGKF